MTALPPAAPRPPFWHDPFVRGLLYQVLVLGGCVAAFLYIFNNTLTNLRARGIASGYGFLSNEAGFAISEVLPIPLPEGGVLVFLLTVGAGLLLTWGLARSLRRKGRALGDDTRTALLVVTLLVVAPALVLYFGWGEIHTESYTEASSYRIALVTGLLNTLKVSLLGCALATLLGVFVGLCRLSSNWLVSRLALAYIEGIRNIPLLVQIFFWYHAVLRNLPDVQESHRWGQAYLNNRGVFLPRPDPRPGFEWVLAALLLAGVLIYFRARHARRRQDATGEQLPVLWPALAALLLLPGAAWLLAGQPVRLSFPVLEGFNFQGGMVLSPEYAALLAGLVSYTSAFIAEIVRSGIAAVDRGQREAAQALGLRAGRRMRLVVLPQALRVIVPPLTSQYLNLTKNSSLGVAIAFPELVSVSGTILNQSGQAIEVIGITMAVYLTFSLLISLGMNWYNARVRLVER